VDLEEEFEQVAIGVFGGVKDDLDRLGVRAVVAVGRVLHVAAGIADAGGDDAGFLADQVLHAPETPAGKDCALSGHGIAP
jgi:hypothetical protein